MMFTGNVASQTMPQITGIYKGTGRWKKVEVKKGTGSEEVLFEAMDIKL